jgi:hypothetical protein
VDLYEDIQLKIKTVVMETLGEDREEKMVVYFVGKQKGLVLNLTNFNTIARICGSDETDDWDGQLRSAVRPRRRSGFARRCRDLRSEP